MIEYELKVQDIFFRLLNKDGFSATRYLTNYILVGYLGENFMFEVKTDNYNLKPRYKWEGKVYVINTFADALSVIYNIALPF